MEPGGVEFIGSDGPTPPCPDGASWQPDPGRSTSRAVRAVRAVVAAALVAAAVGWAVTASHGQHGRAPLAASSPAPSSPVTVSPVTVSPVAPLPARDAPVTGFADVAAALAQYLPKAILTSVVVKSSAGSALVEELIRARENSVQILVRVRPYRHPVPEPTTGITPTPPGLGSAFFHLESASYVVDVQWIGTDATPPPAAALTALADDPRLEMVS